MSKKKVWLLCLIVLSIVSCTHLKDMEKNRPRAGVALPVKRQNTEQKQVAELDEAMSRPDNIVCIDANGKEIEDKKITVEFDTTTNKSSTTTVVMLDEVVVAATTRRNVVERNGMIDVEFVVTVPRELQHKKCMVNILPVLMRGANSDTLPELRYSGAAFREEQESDYAKYDRFLSRIIPDTVDFYHTFVKYKHFDWYMQRRKGMIDRLDNSWHSLERQKTEPSVLFKRFSYFNDDAKNRERLQRERSFWLDSVKCAGVAAKIDRLVTDTVRQTDRRERERFAFFNEKMRRNRGKLLAENESDPAKKGWPMYYYERPKLGLFTIVESDSDQINKLKREFDKVRREGEQRSRLDTLDKSCFREQDSLKLINRIAEKQLKINKTLDWLTERDSLDIMKDFYYTGKIDRNERMKRDKEKTFDKIVHFPHSTTAKVDVLTNADDTLRYRYQYSVRADENSNRMKLYLTGKVQEFSGRYYSMPTSDTLTFFVSSMTFFVVDRVRYIPITIRRDAEANLNVYLSFPVGKSNLIDTLGNNARELSSIRSQMAAVLTDSVYVVDSLQLVANSSPEGNWKKNMELSKARAEAVEHFLQKELSFIVDSVAEGFSVEVDENNNVITHRASADGEETENGVQDITKKIYVGWNGEDWATLTELIGADDKIVHKADILKIIEKEKQPDVREALIGSKFKEDYKYMRAHLYPKLRSVNFHFFLRRKGMKEEVIYTNAVDTAYQRGIELLRKRRYEDALQILKPYEDVNTAVAYMSLGYNEAAGRILKAEEETAHVCYLRAIVGARLKDEKTAVEDFLRACELDAKLRFRGNLDPELSVLINKYELFLDDF